MGLLSLRPFENEETIFIKGTGRKIYWHEKYIEI